MWSSAVEPTTGPILLAVEAVPQSARGLIRTARSGRVADEIVIGTSRRSWLGGLMMGSVAPRVLRRSDLPVVAVPTNGLPRRKRSALPVSA
jgi:nucleotide-binding universal stress UspA family protein